MKLTSKLVSALAMVLLAVPVAAAGNKITLGFAQVGAESEWRTANTESIKKAAAKDGIDLKFSGRRTRSRRSAPTSPRRWTSSPSRPWSNPAGIPS
jgi:ABC-type sugar transport system substrate-binding protein